ncbi:MAG TPA: protein kinase [Polyangia bacterium]|nr:protein kinase [Polyangia bacterium]
MSPPPPLAPPAAPEAVLERGQAIDRFVVLGLVGRGGMGEVYAAYDPDLDRKVAIKLLRTRGAEPENKTRLLREAQAIAKLQHPNVVVVYDVGTFADSVFMAMEFVEGRTVGGWLLAGQRTPREILGVYLAAGRGLAAAHAAGLVHRDFKPDNVMVTNDGQVRVMDFGLARHVTEQETVADERVPPPPSEDLDPQSTIQIGKPSSAPAQLVSSKYLSVKLTQTGAMLGTPAYMSPEQFTGRPTDARTDQFSFCVALYEALYGVRPFSGQTVAQLMTSVTSGAANAPPSKTRVPGWMRKVLLRGLATDPGRRFPSMTALLQALETDPTVRLRWAATAVGALALVLGAAVAAHREGRAAQALCGGGEARLAGVWEPSAVRSARKETIRRAFFASGARDTDTAFASTARLLNEYADRWASMYGEACAATHVRGEQSAEGLDLRMECLNERLGDLSALTDLFARADAGVVEHAVTSAGALARIDRCADVALLRAVVKPPANQATRARVEAERGQLSRLKALAFGGGCKEAAPLANQLLRDVRRTGYQPLLAETLATVSYEVDLCARTHSNLPMMEEAFAVALASHDDGVAAGVAAQIPATIADRAREPERARDWLAIGRAFVARIGGNAVVSADLDFAEAVILQYEGHGPESVAVAARACAAQERLRGKDHPFTLACRNTEAESLEAAGEHERALAAIAAVRDAFARVLGPSHPHVAMAWNNMGEILNSLHRYPESSVAFEHAIEVMTAAHEDAVLRAYPRTGIGLAYLGERRPLDAIEPLGLALEARTEAKAPPELLGETRFSMARALWARPGERGRALQLARLARADYAQTARSAAVAEIDAWLKAPAPGI